MVHLAEHKRQQYRTHAEVFYRPATNAMDVHRPWLESLVEDDDVATLVHEGPHVDGFLVATLVPAPPVYDPGGLTCSVDDFVVGDPTQWASAGLLLLRAAQAWAKVRGAAQSVVVCAPQDEPKRQMLLRSGLEVASEWFTGALEPSDRRP